MNNLFNKLVFITGASKGIGRSCAFSFAEKGANLILTARSEELLENLKEEIIRKYNVKVYTLTLDVSSCKDIKKKIESLPKSVLENIDIIINNAGLALGLDKAFLSCYEDIDRVIDTNVKGVMYITSTLVPYLVKKKFRIYC